MKDNIEEINKETGLTQKQELASSILVAGKSISETAKEVDVDRTTVYNWLKKENFQAVYNRQILEAKANLNNSVISMYVSAVDALKLSLQSSNESIRLKSAIEVIKKIEEMKVGSDNPYSIIKGKCMYETLPSWEEYKLNESEFKRLCTENNLPPE